MLAAPAARTAIAAMNADRIGASAAPRSRPSTPPDVDLDVDPADAAVEPGGGDVHRAAPPRGSAAEPPVRGGSGTSRPPVTQPSRPSLAHPTRRCAGPRHADEPPPGCPDRPAVVITTCASRGSGAARSGATHRGASRRAGDEVLQSVGADGLSLADRLFDRRDLATTCRVPGRRCWLTRCTTPSAAAVPAAGRAAAGRRRAGGRGGRGTSRRRTAVLAMGRAPTTGSATCHGRSGWSAPRSRHSPPVRPSIAPRPPDRAGRRCRRRHAADHGRDVGRTAATPPIVDSPTRNALMRDELYRDLLDRLRTDFERGS